MKVLAFSRVVAIALAACCSLFVAGVAQAASAVGPPALSRPDTLAPLYTFPAGQTLPPLLDSLLQGLERQLDLNGDGVKEVVMLDGPATAPQTTCGYYTITLERILASVRLADIRAALGSNAVEYLGGARLSLPEDYLLMVFRSPDALAIATLVRDGATGTYLTAQIDGLATPRVTVVDVFRDGSSPLFLAEDPQTRRVTAYQVGEVSNSTEPPILPVTWRLAPNPAANRGSVGVAFDEAAVDASVTAYALTGQQLGSLALGSRSGGETVELALAQLGIASAGPYLLRLEADGRRSARVLLVE